MLNTPSDRDLLEIWEQGRHYTLLGKCMLLLERASPGASLEALLQLPIGERDYKLLQLRRRLFGERLTNVAHCPQCEARLEWEMDARTLQVHTPSTPSDTRTFHFEHEGDTVTFRLPNSEDVLEALSDGNGSSEETVLQRCVQAEDPTGKPGKMSESLRQAISRAMADKDPQADLQIDLACPDCGHAWSLSFDILPYLWEEVHDRALRTLRDVAVLAARFGWPEHEILSLSRYRRNLYLTMLQE